MNVVPKNWCWAYILILSYESCVQFRPIVLVKIVWIVVIYDVLVHIPQFIIMYHSIASCVNSVENVVCWKSRSEFHRLYVYLGMLFYAAPKLKLSIFFQYFSFLTYFILLRTKFSSCWQHIITTERKCPILSITQ